jgi:soluble lytic murein transglycosylase-like protein
MRIAAFILTSSLWLMSAAAYADIYSYIDADGTPHFSNQKIDERYQLFMQDEQSYESPHTTPAESAGIGKPLFRALSQHPNLKKYEALLNQAAQEFALDPALLKAIMAAESGFNPTALSPKGAVGLMQLMPSTAQRYGLQGDRKQSIQQKLTDPRTNIRLSARYLRDLYALFPRQLELVIASYNAGEHAVQKYQNKIPPYPETRNYVQLVLQFHRFFKPQSGQLMVADATGSNRVHMTIAGRHNMPLSPAELNLQPQ